MSGPCTDCGGPDYQTLVARIAELEGKNTELRKQNEILSTTRRLEEEARQQAEADLAESNEMYKAAMALWTAETEGRRKVEAALVERDRTIAILTSVVDTAERWARKNSFVSLTENMQKARKRAERTAP